MAFSVTLAAILLKSASTIGKTSEAPAKHYDVVKSRIMVTISERSRNRMTIGVNLVPGPTKPTEAETEGLA